MIRNDVIELPNGKKLEIHPLDATRLMINTSSIAFLEIVKDKYRNTIEVSFEGKETIKVGDQIEVLVGAVNTRYTICAIMIANDETSVFLFSSFTNKTTTFLLPLLGKTKQQLKFNTYFINAYIDTNQEYIGLLYRFTGTNLYKEFEETMIKDKLCVKHSEYDAYHVSYIFRIPDEYKNDIKLFFEGKYSKFSKKLKNDIIKFNGLTKESYIYQVLFKSSSLKKLMEKDLNAILPEDLELASVPIKENETFKLI